MTLAARAAGVPDSPLAAWDARWKLAALAAAAAGAVALTTPAAAAAALAAGTALAVVGRVPARGVVGRLGLVALAVAPVAAVVPLTQPAGDPGWDLGPVRVSLPGVRAAAAVALRALAVGAFAAVLTGTTPLPRLLTAAHALRVPGVLVQVAQLAHRYTFLLAAEARRVRVALRARGFRPRTDPHTYRTTGHAVGSLLVRSGDRADRVAAAMRCRGFDGTYRTAAAFRTTTGDVLGFAAAAAATIALVAADRLF